MKHTSNLLKLSLACGALILTAQGLHAHSGPSQETIEARLAAEDLVTVSKSNCTTIESCEKLINALERQRTRAINGLGVAAKKIYDQSGIMISNSKKQFQNLPADPAFDGRILKDPKGVVWGFLPKMGGKRATTMDIALEACKNAGAGWRIPNSQEAKNLLESLGSEFWGAAQTGVFKNGWGRNYFSTAIVGTNINIITTSSQNFRGMFWTSIDKSAKYQTDVFGFDPGFANFTGGTFYSTMGDYSSFVERGGVDVACVRE